MGELLDFILTTCPQQFRKYFAPNPPPLPSSTPILTQNPRARLPSLYSDFTPLRSSNPDGYTANISAWLTALQAAARAGKIPAPTGAGSVPDRLSITTGEEMLQALETKEHGRPLALASVFVSPQAFLLKKWGPKKAYKDI